MSTNRLPDAAVLDGIVRHLLGARERKAIVACARKGFGASRDLRGITTVAKELGASLPVVAAAFAFLPTLGDPTSYVDVTDVSESAEETAVLPSDKATAAAFALAKLVLGGAEMCPVAY